MRLLPKMRAISRLEHDLFGKPAPTPLSNHAGAGLFRIVLRPPFDRHEPVRRMNAPKNLHAQNDLKAQNALTCLQIVIARIFFVGA